MRHGFTRTAAVAAITLLAAGAATSSAWAGHRQGSAAAAGMTLLSTPCIVGCTDVTTADGTHMAVPTNLAQVDDNAWTSSGDMLGDAAQTYWKSSTYEVGKGSKTLLLEVCNFGAEAAVYQVTEEVFGVSDTWHLHTDGTWGGVEDFTLEAHQCEMQEFTLDAEEGFLGNDVTGVYLETETLTASGAAPAPLHYRFLTPAQAVAAS